MRVLLSDLFFPNKFAKWRISEIHSFIHKYETDIYKFLQLDSFSKVSYDFDWKTLYDSHNLNIFDIYIFDHKYIDLQKYNDPDFDGTKFIGKFPGSYLLRIKKYRKTPILFQNYDCYYFIFKICYDYFIKSYQINRNKCFIHLYPGGGAGSIEQINQYTKILSNQGAKFIITDGRIYENLLKIIPHSSMIYTPCATLCIENEPLNIKLFTPDRPLNICFSSMGDPKVKGFYLYESFINKYLEKFPNHQINFYACGNCDKYSNNPNIIFKHALPQKELDIFYNQIVDIYINLNQSKDLQGFPLGGESMLQGCIVLTTDISNQNGKYLTLNESDGVFIVEPNQNDQIINIVCDLYENRLKCYELGIQAQLFSHKIFGYENQQAKIFDFIESFHSK